MRLVIGSLLVVVISQLLGQFIPPFSILLGTTILIPLAVCFINFSDKRFLGIEFTKKLPVIARVILVYVCVTSSFILDFLYAPGAKDAEGDAVVLLSSFATLIVTCIVLIRYRIKENKRENTKMNPRQLIVIIAIPLSWLLLNEFGMKNILYKIFA